MRIIAIIVSLILIAGCASSTGPAQTLVSSEVDFSADPTEVSGVTEVRFTDLSPGEASAWEWDFDGDGKTDSTERNPAYTYGSNGTFSVTLTVTKASGRSTLTKKDYIKVAGCSS